MKLTSEDVKGLNKSDLWENYLACVKASSSLYLKAMFSAQAISDHNARVYFAAYKQA